MNDQTGFDPKRRLCPDGTCTGVVGLDGRCGECGRAAGGGNGGNAGNAIRTVANNSDLTDVTKEGGFDPDGDGSQAGTASPAAAGDGVGGFDVNRRLCDDGTCVGVVGSGGACTVCGRVAG